MTVYVAYFIGLTILYLNKVCVSFKSVNYCMYLEIESVVVADSSKHLII